MKSIKDYKDEIVGVIKKMNQEHGDFATCVRISSEPMCTSKGEVFSMKYNVQIEF